MNDRGYLLIKRSVLVFENYFKTMRRYIPFVEQVVEIEEDIDDPITDEIEKSLWGLKNKFDFDTEEIKIVVKNYKNNNLRRK
tara:strand:- start:1405 stop:1650 length:246 start_codon:yes stop_codon:yes gene_type:complete